MRSALHPEEYLAAAAGLVDADGALGSPVAHAMPMRDDARAARELALEARLQLQVHVEREEQRHDARAGELGVEQVLLPEGDALGDTGRRGIGARLGDTLRVDVDAHTARAVALRGLDGDAAVAAAEIVDHVARADRRQLEHRRDHTWRRRLVAHLGRRRGRRLRAGDEEPRAEAYSTRERKAE